MQGNEKKPIVTDAERIGAIKRKEQQGAKITKAEIMSVKDAQTRQAFIAKHIDLFTRKK